MKRTSIIFIILLFITNATYAGSSALPWVELTFRPSTETKTDSQIRLLPTEAEQTEGDAVPLYQKAIKSLPEDFQQQKFLDWRKLPSEPDQLPIEEIESELKKLKPTIDLLTQAARCKQCNWPFIKPGQIQQQDMDDLAIYRQLAIILDVQAKIQIVQGQYDKAIETIKTNLKLANHLGSASSLVQAIVGNAIGYINLGRIEQLIQSHNAPNLYHALKDLPKPLADVNKAIKVETDNLKNYNFLVRPQFRKILEPAHEQIRKQMNHVERKITALQIIEALRLYTGKHDGKFPEKLSDITESKIPNDPVTKKPFSYSRIGSKAILELEGTEGSEGRDAIRYELNLKE